MKANSLVIGGALRNKLAGCKAGESKEISVKVKFTNVSEDEVHAEIVGVTYEEPEPAAAPKKKMRGPKALYDAIES